MAFLGYFRYHLLIVGISFDDLIGAAVKACEDDIKGRKRECLSTEEVRDRVVAYLEDIAKHKCSNQSEKEADEKGILGRMHTVSIRSVSQVRVSH